MSVTAVLECSATEDAPVVDSWLGDTCTRMADVQGVTSSRVLKQLPSDKPQVVFVLGGPGAGKGTQCARIQETFGYVHISAGDCLRAERASGSKDAELINHYIKEGQIVPVEITVKLLQKAMRDSGKSKFLIDGFPRNVDNVDGWNRVVGPAADVAFVLFFDAPEEVMERRLLKRGESSGRVDDNLESIRKRFRTYRDSSLPVIHAFEAQGKVRHVNADNGVDDVFQDVSRIMTALDTSLDSTHRLRVDYMPKVREDALKRFGSKLSMQYRLYSSPAAVSSAGAGAGASAGASVATKSAACMPKCHLGLAVVVGAIVGFSAASFLKR